MGDCNGQTGKRANPIKRHRAGTEKRKLRHLGRMGMLQNMEDEIDVENPNGVTKTDIYYILTNRPDIVIDVRVISHINIGNDDTMAPSNNFDV